jgi:phosphoesterase RecJ-like protein
MEVLFERILEEFQKANFIVLTGHIHPDGDCLGSMLALNEYLESEGKRVQMLLDGDVPEVYYYLPGSCAITRPLPGIMDCDLLVVVDASDEERLGSVKSAIRAKTLNIDHHISNNKFADYWYIDTKAAATGEIILQLLEYAKATITLSMAVNLYTAIASDCGFFRYANTTSATLRYAAALVDVGVQPHFISEYLETKPLESVMTLRNVLDTLEIYRDGKIASIIVSQEITDNASENTEGLINYPRNIEGVEIAIMFKIIDGNSTRVSFRSRNVDVSQLALSFGGGGHMRAAGCAVNGEFSVAKALIIQAVIDLINRSAA